MPEKLQDLMKPSFDAEAARELIARRLKAIQGLGEAVVSDTEEPATVPVEIDSEAA